MPEVRELEIGGVLEIVPDRRGDDRGFFSEVYNREWLAGFGLKDEFVQDNHSLSRKRGTVRGLHFQIEPHAIAKLVRVTRGAVLDVIVDIRHGSPSFGRHVAVVLTAENWKQIYAPIGTAHGFCTLEDDTEVTYKVTDHWSPEVDCGLAWDDPDLAIEWPVSAGEAVLSDKDRRHPRLTDLEQYFSWSGG